MGGLTWFPFFGNSEPCHLQNKFYSNPLFHLKTYKLMYKKLLLNLHNKVQTNFVLKNI